ncbi:SDR family NAD(P)-dependent oxidoreductase [Streptomyces halstedii]
MTTSNRRCSRGRSGQVPGVALIPDRCREPGLGQRRLVGEVQTQDGAPGESRFGLTVARSLGRDGLRIFLRARHTVAVTAELQREDSPDADGRSRDVRSTEQVDAVVRAAAVRYSPVDVLVNNTGRQQGREAPPTDTTDKLRLDAVDTNLHSVFRVTRAAPATRGQGMPENSRERITDLPSTGRKQGIVPTTPHPPSIRPPNTASSASPSPRDRNWPTPASRSTPPARIRRDA